MIWMACTVMMSALSAANGELTVLDPASEPGKMMTVYLNRLADEALDRRSAAVDAFKSAEEITPYQQELRRFFFEQLGPLPEKTDLNARVVDKQSRDGYRYEKIIFESRPGMFVTGVLFLPLCDAPYPGVLFPCGHSANGKLNEVYQRACILLAKNGIAAFIYDPIGQGERYQLLDAKGKPRFGSTTEHTIVGVSCIPLGLNTASYRVWDGIRGLDYLASRPEIDPKRIGCTGNSGGGTMTSYLMALDDRIACAAPGCYITSFKRLLAEAGPQDAEQCIYGQIAKGMDHADYVIMRAPKPTIMLTATRDFFDIRGGWESYRDAKRVYGKLGFPERLEIVEANEQHGYSLPLRTGMVRWMRRWLSHVDEPIVEGDFPILSETEIQCSPAGQVMLMEHARSVLDFNKDALDAAARERRTFTKAASRDDRIAKIRSIAGVRPLKDLPEPEVKQAGDIDRGAYKIEKLILTPEPGVTLPALALVPTKPEGDAYLYLHDAGKAAAVESEDVAKLLRDNHIVLAVDLHGIGETTSTSRDKGWNEQFGTGWPEYYRAYLLGKSYVGMRAEDVLVCARYLASRAPSQRVRAVAIGQTGLAAMHAVALEPGAFASLLVEHALRSWEDIVLNPLAKNQLLNTVHGALRAYDLPDLVSLARGTIRVKDSLVLGKEEKP